MTIFFVHLDMHSCTQMVAARGPQCGGYGGCLTPGSTADGTVMDSGVIRHLKLKLRKRLSKENGGRRQVLNKDRMMEICEEVWDAIKIEELRPSGKAALQR